MKTIGSRKNLPTLFGRFFLFIVIASVLTIGCGKLDSKPDFTFINGAEPETIDPHLLTGQPDGRIAECLFEGLCAHEGRNGGATNGVAERWEISNDKLNYKFFLRKTTWSNGDPVTAQDFIWSWVRCLKISPYASQLHFIKNGKQITEGKAQPDTLGVRAVDDYTLEIQLEYPTPFFLDLLATPPYAPIPGKVFEKFGDQWLKPGNIVGNGPYLLKEHKLKDYFLLVKNDKYWNRDNVQLATVKALSVEKASTALNIYLQGQADLLLDKSLIPPEQIQDLRARPDFHSSPFLATYFYRFNVTKPPFNNVLVRKSISAAINKQRIVERITKGGEPLASSLTPPGTPNYEPPKGIEYNPEQARKWLEEAGYPAGKEFPVVTLLYNTSEVHESVAIEIQDMLKKELNLSIVTKPQDWKVYLSSLNNLDFELARSSWVADYPDANTFLNMFVSDDGNNRTGWSNKEYDSLILAAAKEADVKKREQIFQKAETILVRDEVPIIPIYYFVGMHLYDASKWTGIYPNIVDNHPIWEIKRAAK